MIALPPNLRLPGLIVGLSKDGAQAVSMMFVSGLQWEVKAWFDPLGDERFDRVIFFKPNPPNEAMARKFRAYKAKCLRKTIDGNSMEMPL